MTKLSEIEKRPVTEEDIKRFVDRAQAMVDQDSLHSFKLVVEMMQKRARIVADRGDCDRSAWAFIDLATGDILKAAGWKRPAKHARGNINTPTDGVEFVGVYGPAYLR